MEAGLLSWLQGCAEDTSLKVYLAKGPAVPQSKLCSKPLRERLHGFLSAHQSLGLKTTLCCDHVKSLQVSSRTSHSSRKC